MNRKLFTLALCSATALGLGACGDDSPPPMTDSGIIIDGGGDTGTPDTGTAPDTGAPDTGPPLSSCDVGDICDTTRGCRVSPFCIGQIAGELGGTDDPIQDLPGGGIGVPQTSWVGNYCSTIAPIDMGGCDPDDADSCGGADCGTCLDAGPDERGVRGGICATSCTPSLVDNGVCRDSYDCGLTAGACVPGCSSDEECRVYRKDTNGNGFIDDGDLAAEPPLAPDALVYDEAPNGSCDLETYRCVHEGGGGVAGDACTWDGMCEANGDCIADDGSGEGWVGGYCTKFACDLAGNDCAAPGKCQERGIGIALCTQACRVAETTDGDPYSDNANCAPGFSCFWDGTSGESDGNGACVPGTYNDIRADSMTGQTGETCDTGDDCHSPFGGGQCRDFGGGNHCTFFDCGAPGMPTDVCGAEGLCATVSGSDTTLCARACTSADECLDGNGCWDTSPAGINTGGMPICFPGCLEDSHCGTGQTCVGASATAVGACM